MWAISREFGIPIQDIINDNPDYKGFKKDPEGNLIYAGDTIKIRGANVPATEKTDEQLKQDDKEVVQQNIKDSEKKATSFLGEKLGQSVPLISSGLVGGVFTGAPSFIKNIAPNSKVSKKRNDMIEDKSAIQKEEVDAASQSSGLSQIENQRNLMQTYIDSIKRNEELKKNSTEKRTKETILADLENAKPEERAALYDELGWKHDDTIPKKSTFISGKKGAIVPTFDEGGENQNWLLTQMQNPTGNMFTSGYSSNQEEGDNKKTTNNTSSETGGSNETSNIKKDGYWKSYKKKTGKSWQKVILERKARKQRHKEHLKKTGEWDKMNKAERRLSLQEAKYDVEGKKHTYKKGSGWKNPTLKK